MSEIGCHLLKKLLTQADRGGRETLPINERSAKEYFSIKNLSGRDSIHAYLSNAQENGAITLEWGKGSESQDLKRLRLLDADKLSEWLGVARASSYSEMIEKELAIILQNSPEWLDKAYKDAMSLWSLGKIAFRTQVEDIDTAVNLFRVALSISNGEQEGIDLRRYSVRLLNDSKLIEGMLNKLAQLLRYNPAWSQFEDNNELFRILGLEKFPPPIFIKGPLVFNYSEYKWDISELRPFVGLSPDMVEAISLASDISYVLTIENLASFQRHVREIKDDSIVIYSAGFPSPALTHILKWIDKCVPVNTKYFHWGDRDIGGIRIFNHIESNLTRHKLIPHLMNEPISGNSRFNKNEVKQLKAYSSLSSSSGNMAKLWLENNLSPIEQEIQDPVSPI